MKQKKKNESENDCWTNLNSKPIMGLLQKMQILEALGFWLSVVYHLTGVNTVNFLNIRTPKTFVVITLKFELYGSTIE